MSRRFAFTLSIIALAMLAAGAGGAWAGDEPPARLLYWHEEDDGRIVVSNIRFSRNDVLELGGRERIEERASSQAMLVLVTNRRMVAYSVYTAAWREVPRKATERLEQLQAEDYSAFVLTSDRVLNFNGRNGVWSEDRR
jgi:hypothetical protein